MNPMGERGGPPVGGPESRSPRGVLVLAAPGPSRDDRVEQLRRALPEIEIHTAAHPAEAMLHVDGGLACLMLEGTPGEAVTQSLGWMEWLQLQAPRLPVVAIVDDDADGAVLGEAGARDHLLRQEVTLGSLGRSIRHAIAGEREQQTTRELARLRTQTAESARIQRGLIPRLVVDDDRIATRSGYRPGERRQVLGGDFFDAIQTSPDRLNVVLGDVCGHGPDEAVLGVQLRIAWRSLVLAGIDHGQILITLDRLAEHERHAAHIFVTLASVEIDLATGLARVGLAGHPPPIVLRDGQVDLITDMAPGPPLGLRLPPRWALDEVPLGEAWTLLLYSDGIYEGRAPSPTGRLGIDGLVELLAAEDGEAIWEAVPGRLLDQVETLNAGPLEDDVALLALRRSAQPAS